MCEFDKADGLPAKLPEILIMLGLIRELRTRAGTHDVLCQKSCGKMVLVVVIESDTAAERKNIIISS